MVLVGHTRFQLSYHLDHMRCKRRGGVGIKGEEGHLMPSSSQTPPREQTGKGDRSHQLVTCPYTIGK